MASMVRAAVICFKTIESRNVVHVVLGTWYLVGLWIERGHGGGCMYGRRRTENGERKRMGKEEEQVRTTQEFQINHWRFDLRVVIVS